MSEQSVATGASKDSIHAALLKLPAKVKSREIEAQAMLRRAGLVLLGLIKEAFVIKSRGGIDETGDRWAPLKPATIAYTRGRRTKRERSRADRPSQALTAKQQEQWWELYRQGLAMYGVGKDGKGHAAARAWFIMRQRGVTTLFDKYKNTKALILNRTGALLESLTPGSHSPDQVLRTDGGALVVGTTRAGAMAHHHGVPKRLPQRRLWPEPRRWPKSWWGAITAELQKGIVEIVVRQVRSTR